MENMIDEYIKAQPEYAKEYLERIRKILRSALPDAEERISWSMPTFWKGKNIIHFAAFKKHIGIYPGPDAIEHFAKELESYKTSKGAIQLPYNKEIPESLIKKIAIWQAERIKEAQKN